MQTHLESVCLALACLVASCSLLIDDRADQCSVTADCARFPGTTCDAVLRTCRFTPIIDEAPINGSANASGRTDAGVSGAASGELRAVGDGGCAPPGDVPNANACTNARCRRFDNVARLTKLTRDGGLPPLPAPRDAGAQVR